MRGCSPRQDGGQRWSGDRESRRVVGDGALRGLNREHEQQRAKLRGKILSGEVLYHANVLCGLLNSPAGRRKVYTTMAPTAGRLDVCCYLCVTTCVRKTAAGGGRRGPRPLKTSPSHGDAPTRAECGHRQQLPSAALDSEEGGRRLMGGPCSSASEREVECSNNC
jgi:hypothetical protein